MPKKKKINKKTYWVQGFILIIIGMLCYLGYEWWNTSFRSFKFYDEFGIEIPNRYNIHGIDVSRYQSNIQWKLVKDMKVDDIQLHFAFIKATEGVGNQDKFFNRNWSRAKDAGVVRGAYHFFLPSKSGKQQAENFIRTVEILPGDLPPVLDVEVTNRQSSKIIRERVKEWLETVENYYGITPILYTNIDFYNRHLGDDFDEYPLWIAHYKQKERPRIHRNWHFWQHSEEGLVNGIAGQVDFNVFNGDSADFKKILVH